MAGEAAVYVYDFTLWNEATDEAKVAEALKGLAKNWAFQLERGGEGGKLHWQGRLSLRTKKRLSELVGLLVDTPLQGAHLSRTSGVNSKNFNYVMKKDTRERGPWTDKDEEPVPEPKEIKGKMLYPWQDKVIQKIKTEENDRVVNCIVDLAGCSGKGFLRKYVNFHKIAKAVPDCNEAKQLISFAFQFRARAYVVDIPRARGKRHARAELWRGIEQLKDGYLVEHRYKAQEVQLAESPSVWVFTNEMPDEHMLSADRWKLWCIDPKTNDLIPWKPGREAMIEKWVKEKRAKTIIVEEEEDKGTEWDPNGGASPLGAAPPDPV